MSFRSQLRQTVSIKNPTGARDLHGEAALGAAVDYPARFERASKTTLNAEREREPVHGLCVLGPEAAVSRGAQLTYSSEKYRVIEIAEGVDGSGNVHHYELKCQLWGYDT